MDAKLRAKILDVLMRHHFMALATIRPDGYPQATTVNYIHDDLTIYFATDATSKKAGNIQLNDKVSVAIASETQDAYKLRGVSLSGTAKRVVDAGRLQELHIRLFQKQLGWFRLVHVKSVEAQQIRMLLVNRNLLLGKLQDIENSVRGSLKAFGLHS